MAMTRELSLQDASPQTLPSPNLVNGEDAPLVPDGDAA
jgi:hypothetical protein